MKRQSSIKTQGFTILELMITLAVVAILVVIAVPNFNKFVLNGRLQSESEKLLISLNQARQLAITNNTKGFLCRTTQQFSAGTLNCANSGTDWHGHQYMTYTINTSDTTQRATLLSKLSSASAGSALGALKINQLITNSSDRKQQIKSFETTGDVTIKTNKTINVVAFNSDGTLYNTAPIYFAVCDDRASPEDFGRYIEISQSGRIRIAPTNTGNTLTSCDPS